MGKRLCVALAAATVALGAAGAQGQDKGFVLFGGDDVGPGVPLQERFVHPVTSPYFHEDSFVTTDVRAWYLYHKFDGNEVIDGGDAQVVALQARLAITDQLQLVAYKDGYTIIDSGLVEDEGWNDVAAGLKWAFLQRPEQQLYAAVGAGYQFSLGDDEVLQDRQEARLWASANKGFDKLHLGATVNYLIATGDKDEAAFGQADRLTWHLHADYWLNDWFSPVLEVNGYHAVNERDEVVPFGGADVTTLGGGDDLVTIGAGAEVRPTEDIGIRAAYELPVTGKEDMFDWRVTVSVVYSF